ncbi:Nitrogen permease regulator 2 [Parelaphostrongylus tenuis]|uniref:Nitrogen permease regulator 2 n=1 Tax=Parelaphostrongylus tenuis TaxID=148309 RepID=A0AAD5QJ42_PARTN|nr:Nitrogen permease regulator 2 [Parelaphostrongylus tenuis]
MGKNGVRFPTFYFDGLDKHGKQILLGTATVEDDIGLYEPLYASESEIWWTRGGVTPHDEPLCGFEGDKARAGSTTIKALVLPMKGRVALGARDTKVPNFKFCSHSNILVIMVHFRVLQDEN